MKNLKKIIAVFLSVLMLFSLGACTGEYEWAIGGGNFLNSDASAPELDDDPSNDFTITLKADGQPYTPRTQMYAEWRDGFSIHRAPVDKNGVARIDGLDGDYRVTLTDVPNEYTYDPNGNIATNDMRNIIVNLYTLNRLTGGGTGPYDCYNFTKVGVYCATIDDPNDAIFFQYAPDRSGTYTIESWADTAADNINPYIDVYIGSTAWKQYAYTTDDGGSIGSYTINFIHTVQIADENISSGGQAVYTFAVKAESKNNKYPITITFAVKRDGNFELGGVDSISGNEMVISQHDFSNYDIQAHTYDRSEYRMKYPEYKFEGMSNVYVFDESGFKIWKVADGGDDFYHVYNKDAYPDTDGYGPILYANITSACRFIDVSFSRIEYNANNETINNALRVNGKNYKHLIEGYEYLSTFGNINGGSYYCVSDCPCHDASVSTSDWACTPACQTCTQNCRRCPEALIGKKGYKEYANNDGMVAVTAELKEFLLGYSSKQTFFWDGQGTLEKNPTGGKYYQAVGESGWLFACAYYEQI